MGRSQSKTLPGLGESFLLGLPEPGEVLKQGNYAGILLHQALSGLLPSRGRGLQHYFMQRR